jgi:hypothetical protein
MNKVMERGYERLAFKNGKVYNSIGLNGVLGIFIQK